MGDFKLALYMFLFVVICVFEIKSDEFDYVDYQKYCDLNCVTQHGIAKHIICKRKNNQCRPDRRCRNYEVVPMTGQRRQQILDLHNKLRNNVAMGNESRGMHNEPQPTAANMNALAWNEELALIAQCTANTCKFAHDSCRRTETLLVGQNLAYRGQSWESGLADYEIFKFLIESWYNEVADFNNADISYFQGSSPGTGHYSEMVWGELEYLGCAAITYEEDSWYKLFLVCNYGGKSTPGNFYGREIYKIGSPCSKCEYENGCNKKFRGLCETDVSGYNYYNPSTYTPYDRNVNSKNRISNFENHSNGKN